MSEFETRLVVDGIYSEGAGNTEPVYEAATGQRLAEVRSASPEQVDMAVQSAGRAFGGWSRTMPKERSRALLSIADAIENKAADLSVIESRNTGKPLRYVQGGEISNVADVFRFFATAVRNMPGTVAGNYRTNLDSSMRRDPIGVIAQIAPWNYPLLMAAWKIAPAIAAGNTVVIKPSEHTPLSLLALCAIFADHLPPGVVNVICGNGPEIGQALISHDLVRMISLTGDVGTGRAVLKAAAGNRIKRTHLELGGKAPVIVNTDADLDRLVETLREASFYNAGQDCTAACRIFAHRDVAKELTDRLAAMIGTLVYGAPDRNDVEFGPLVTQKQQERVAGFITRAKGDAECRIVSGGSMPDQPGYYYAPTLIAAPFEAEVVQKEIFGPVVTITPVDSMQQALEWANASEYGLASSVWSRDAAVAARIADLLEYGVTWVNTHGSFATEMPHGGMKNSGYGSDLSMQSLLDYTQVRHVMTAR